MKIAVIYIYPMMRTRVYFPLARRFAETYRKFHPGIPHDLYVICNGATPGPNEKSLFNSIPCTFITHNNVGWDIGAYQACAEKLDADMMVCLGAPVHFYQDGWLARMEQAFIENSPALFGCWGVPYRTCWHIRTTAFWLAPDLLRAYPAYITSAKSSRYEFEYGENSITAFAEKAGFDPLMVTWDEAIRKDRWQDVFGGKGNCLVFDQFTHHIAGEKYSPPS